MVQMEGKYALERNENLDEYFKAVGVPLIPRKIMCSTSPALEISKNDTDDWTITISTIFRTIKLTFKLGEEYEESMPGGVIKSVTTIEDDKLVTHSIAPGDVKLTRTYEFSDTHCTIHMKHEKSGKEAKRFFKRV